MRNSSPTSGWPNLVAFPDAGPWTMPALRAATGPGTRLVGVIGSPVTHSLSPRLHTAAFEALGLAGTWRSAAFDVPPGQAAAAMADMRQADVAGLSVTMPHKAEVADLVDECTAVARRLEAVNCVVNDGGLLTGTNTDGEGFVASLARGAGFDPRGRRCLVLGAGGAARAVVLALAGSGASAVVVANRTPQRAAAAAALAGGAGSVVALSGAALAEALAEADLVVNATPVGMEGVPGDESWAVDPHRLGPGQVAADLVYAPRPTRWLAEAGASGATMLDGLGMLVHQAAAQIALWTGLHPPVEAMWRAVDDDDDA
jgi:shikimate dehydrogenase